MCMKFIMLFKKTKKCGYFIWGNKKHETIPMKKFEYQTFWFAIIQNWNIQTYSNFERSIFDHFIQIKHTHNKLWTSTFQISNDVRLKCKMYPLQNGYTKNLVSQTTK